MAGETVVSRAELGAALRDLEWCLDLMLIPPEEREDPAARPPLATMIGVLCLAWALVRRSLPSGCDVRDLVKLGARALLDRQERLAVVPAPRPSAIHSEEVGVRSAAA